MAYSTDLTRKKTSNRVAGGASNTEMRYNDEAGASKSISVEALMKPAGLASTSFATIPANRGQMIAFFNSLTTPIYIAFDNGLGTTVAALGSAHALKPLDYTYLIVPPEAVQYRASAAGAAVFEVADSSYLG